MNAPTHDGQTATGRAATGRARRRTRLPLRRVLVLPFLLQLFVAVGLTGWLSIRHGRQAVDEVAGRLRDELTNHIREYLKAYLETPHLINELNADAIRLGQLDPRDPEALGRHFWHQFDQFENAAFIFFGSPQGGSAGAGRQIDGTTTVDTTDWDPEQGLVAGTRFEYLGGDGGERLDLLSTAPGFDARRRPWFVSAKSAGRAVWSDVYTLFVEDALAIAASRPVYDRDGKLLGVLGVDIRLAGINAFLRELAVGKTGRTFILERSGYMVGSSASEGPLIAGASGRGPGRLPAASSAEPQIGGTTWRLINRFGEIAAIDGDQQLTITLDGERHFVQVAPLADGRGLDWLIVVVVPEADFMGPILANRRRTIALCLVAFALATALGLLTARWIARPIRRLSAASQSIASGDLDQAIEVRGVEELEDLAGSFNQMAAQLKGSFGELESRVGQRTAELREAKEAADAANQAKTRFLANISHEIRTPLAAVLGYVELLWDRHKSAEEAEEYLRTIRNSGGHLNQLLSDLLDISRIEAGRLDLDLKPCDLAEMLAYLSSAFEPQAHDRGLRLEIETDAWLPWRFDADTMRLRQILSNLLGNAIKYTEQGRVTLTVRAGTESSSAEISPAVVEPARPEDAVICFTVEDTGAGISEEDQRRLFRRFTQLDTAGDMRRSGFGLGLSITRQLTELMGGEVSVESQLGDGSRFAVRVPVSACQDWARAAQEYHRLSRSALLFDLPRLSGRVLIADDSKALQVLCRRMLERWGLECTTVGDGGRAVEEARRNGFDFVLMDWQMPEMDGLQATRKLRRLGVETPIVALTAAAMSGDREKCLAAGCDDYLVKPIDFKELYRLLARRFSEPGSGASRAGPAVAIADDPELAELVRGFVQGLPEKVDTLKMALAESDWPAFTAAVHKLVGTAGSYGLGDIYSVAEELEAVGTRRDAERAGLLLERLATRVKSAVESVAE